MQISQSSEIKGQHRLTEYSCIIVMDNIARNINIDSIGIKFKDLQNIPSFYYHILILLILKKIVQYM